MDPEALEDDVLKKKKKATLVIKEQRVKKSSGREAEKEKEGPVGPEEEDQAEDS